MKKHVNVVFIGHVDAGKSTISGHILFLNGIVDERTLEKYEREAKAKVGISALPASKPHCVIARFLPHFCLTRVRAVKAGNTHGRWTLPTKSAPRARLRNAVAERSRQV